MSSAQSQSAPQSVAQATPVLPEDMDLEEVMRVMDVASTLRREQQIVEREFNLEKTKELLREKLRNTAELTGETLTPEQIEAAVNWYYDNLHEYEEPEKSFTWFLAQLYVLRKSILGFLIPIAVALGTIWALWFAPFAPFSESNKSLRALAAANQTVENQIKSIRSQSLTPAIESKVVQIQNEANGSFEAGDVRALELISEQLVTMDDSIRSSNKKVAEIEKHSGSIGAVAKAASVKTEVIELKAEAEQHWNNLDVDSLEKIRERLAVMDKRINEEFTLTVVGGENQRSATRRDFEDKNGKRVSGYYLIVQARDSEGSLLKRRIQNIETDKFHVVDTWGEKVPEAVYERLKKDKTDDGVLNETTFGKKIRGELNVQMIMPGADDKPIERSGQITEW